MSDRVNCENSFLVKNLIDCSIVTHAKLAETCKISRQGFRGYAFKTCTQPFQTLDDPAAYRSIDPRQVADCIVEQSQIIGRH
jgi:hypothetical protein